MTDYILQVLLYQLIFLIAYEIFFKKETFFSWNRYYLLISAGLSYILPLINIRSFAKYVKYFHGIQALNPVNLNYQADTSKYTVLDTTFINLTQIYIIGFGIMLLLFIWKLFQLLYKIHTHKVLNYSTYKIVLLKEKHVAFSFLNYIFISKAVFDQNPAPILAHELIHIKEKHSLDLLFFEIQKIVFWFNPLIYLYQHKIMLLHEYIADQKTLKTIPKQSFYENLLLQNFAIEKLPFINQYSNQTLLKKRIMMTTKKQSNPILKVKYLMVLPLIFTMLFMASCDKTDQSVRGQIPTESKIENTPKTFTLDQINKAPVFPGCEKLNDNNEIKACFSRKIREFVINNFDKKIMNDLPAGKYKILTQFHVDYTGKVTNIKAKADVEKLKKEAIKVLKRLPDMQPAELADGQKVGLTYTLPIILIGKK